jgi:hypothetical protein
MTGADGRLNKMYRGLTAKERAILVLSAWKQDRDEDLLARRKSPLRFCAWAGAGVTGARGTRQEGLAALGGRMTFVARLSDSGWYTALEGAPLGCTHRH